MHTVHHTLSIRTNTQSAYLLPICPNSRHHKTYGTAHNFYKDEQSVYNNCCSVALTVSSKLQTEHHTISILTKSQSDLHDAFCTKRSKETKTAHNKIAIVTKSQSKLPVALLH